VVMVLFHRRLFMRLKMCHSKENTLARNSVSFHDLRCNTIQPTWKYMLRSSQQTTSWFKECRLRKESVDRLLAYLREPVGRVWSGCLTSTLAKERLQMREALVSLLFIRRQAALSRVPLALTRRQRVSTHLDEHLRDAPEVFVVSLFRPTTSLGVALSRAAYICVAPSWTPWFMEPYRDDVAIELGVGRVQPESCGHWLGRRVLSFDFPAPRLPPAIGRALRRLSCALQGLMAWCRGLSQRRQGVHARPSGALLQQSGGSKCWPGCRHFTWVRHC